MSKPKYTIDLKVSENEIRHLMRMYAQRIEQSVFGEHNPGYLDWNIERLVELRGRRKP